MVDLLDRTLQRLVKNSEREISQFSQKESCSFCRVCRRLNFKRYLHPSIHWNIINNEKKDKYQRQMTW